MIEIKTAKSLLGVLSQTLYSNANACIYIYIYTCVGMRIFGLMKPPYIKIKRYIIIDYKFSRHFITLLKRKDLENKQ